MQRAISRLNLVGLALVAAGAVKYTIVSANERKLRAKRGATSAGSGKKTAANKSSAASLPPPPLLPTTTVSTPIMVNGKRPLKIGKTEQGSGAGKKKVRGIAWGAWWRGGNGGDVSRRSK